MINLYTYEFISKMTKKYRSERLGKVLRKYLKRRRSVGEIEDQHNQLTKYSRRKRTNEEFEDQYSQLSKYLKSQPEETIGERVKLMPGTRKKQELD